MKLTSENIHKAGGSAAPRSMLNLAPTAHFFGIEQETARSNLHQKLPALHHLFAVEPDVEVTAGAIIVNQHH
ncbi:MAG: hypothetical protein DMF46_08875 [Verrucomicrobia bacterium]|nr:MAG: hypothetical protein DMF46_08875 [Verrucomicrobiota bacterium]